MLLKISFIFSILVAYLNIDPGESCTVKKKIHIIVRTLPPNKEKNRVSAATSTTTTTPTSTLTTSETCICGRANDKKEQVSSRIINGTNATINEYPWIVPIGHGLGDGIKFVTGCAGTIISSKTILTAAHCLMNTTQVLLKFGLLSVAVGEHNINKLDNGQRFVKVCNITQHPKFNYPTTIDYDYGFLTLCEELIWSSKVSPVCLPDISGRGSIYENKEAIVAGWGDIEEGYFPPVKPNEIIKKVSKKGIILQEAMQKTMTNTNCQALNAFETKLTDRMICGFNPNQSACHGDSGGPLIVQENGTEDYTIVGIVSFGNDNCTLGNPGVYARVTEQLDWIISNIQGSRCL